jgi:hypothetical protein
MGDGDRWYEDHQLAASEATERVPGVALEPLAGDRLIEELTQLGPELLDFGLAAHTDGP